AGREAQLPEAVEAARRHRRELGDGGADLAHAVTAPAEGGALVEVAVDRIVDVVLIAGAEEALGEPRHLRHAQRRAVQRGPAPALGHVALVAVRVVDDTEDDPTADLR